MATQVPPTPTRLWMPESWTSARTPIPTISFKLQPNAGSVRGYRFVRKNDKKRQQGLFFIDGACLDNGAGPDGPREPRAGAAVVFAPSDWYNPIKDALPLDGVPHTSNRAELRAALVALGLRVWGGEGFENIILATDSEYLVLGISERIHKWKENGWKTSSGTQVKNKDLWVALYAKIREVEEYNCHVQFWLIPRAWNEADKYAKEAAALPDGERATGAGAITTPVMMMERM
ncbi:ribonuclease H-like domain-containing protein [Ephemerocybe angulata]|uniref:ribonuclease H n=1 Tax=Ephemerocybe angulata TaxID=980116 RepID=A0A8H6LX67_9AGAR|nr:ribonuclease H-like domain-containing protein [Tulosesus angulatus]